MTVRRAYTANDVPFDDALSRLAVCYEGMSAWLAGIPLAHNPYRKARQPNLHDSWAAGWRMCDEDQFKEATVTT